MIETLLENAERAREAATAEAGADVHYDRHAVVWINKQLNHLHQHGALSEARRSIELLGAFFGECIIHTYGGEWFEDDFGWSIRFAKGNAAYPFTKVEKHLMIGHEESVLTLFDTLAVLFGFDNHRPI